MNKKIIELKCIEKLEGKYLTEGKKYHIHSIKQDNMGNNEYNIIDDRGESRHFRLHGFLYKFEPIYENTIDSKFTTSIKDGLYSLQDIQNILEKFEFDEKDLEEVIREFKKLIINNKGEQVKIEFNVKEEAVDDNLPF